MAFKKMALLMNAAKQANEQEDALDELKAAAFEVLLLHPGCNCARWATILTEQYGTELIDAFGSDGEKIHSSLMKLWRSRYHDGNSGLTWTYETWAKAFATGESVQMFYDMINKT